jgi:hypothetical protein
LGRHERLLGKGEKEKGKKVYGIGEMVMYRRVGYGK